MIAPDLTYENALLAASPDGVVIGMDEVGRGALAGPVTVGVCAVASATGDVPVGLADSKLLTPAARERLCEPIDQWCVAWAVGHATAREIDSRGIVGALRLAGRRALAQVLAQTGPVTAVILDGSHDWLSHPALAFDFGTAGGEPQEADPLRALCPAIDPWDGEVPVVTRVKADMTCASVAAASVVAKVTRDALMVALAGAEDLYGWRHNKGYASASHRAALAARGTSPHHRLSWHLPGMTARLPGVDGP